MSSNIQRTEFPEMKYKLVKNCTVTKFENNDKVISLEFFGGARLTLRTKSLTVELDVATKKSRFRNRPKPMQYAGSFEELSGR